MSDNGLFPSWDDSHNFQVDRPEAPLDVEEGIFNLSMEDEIKKKPDSFVGVFLSKKRIFLLLGLISLTFLFFWGRLFYLQVIKGNDYYAIAESNRTKFNVLRSQRGIIYDSQGFQLIKNIPVFDISVVPAEVYFSEDSAENIKQIEKFTGMEKTAIEAILNKYPKSLNEAVIIKENIDKEQALKLMVIFEDYSYLEISYHNLRQYLDGNSMSHILGYQGKINQEEYKQLKEQGYYLNDYLGKTGLELSYEKSLRGSFGYEEFEVDAFGRPGKILSKKETQTGENLVLTIDSDWQNKIYELLGQKLALNQKSSGVVIIMEPNTGDIKSMVSYPSYDNNLFSLGISNEDYSKLINDQAKPLYNRIISGEYPSGSIIKPFIALAALEDGLITDRTAVYSTGGIMYADRWWFPDWKAGGHGRTNLYDAIAWSVNTYFYYIGGGDEDFEGLGVDKINKYLAEYGFGIPTEIDLSHEKKGLLPDPAWKESTKNEQWYIGDTYHLAIGQGDFLVTPLQMARSVSFLANGGKVVQPRLVKAFENPQTGEISENGVKVFKSGEVSQDNLDKILKAMRGTVSYGSAQLLNNLNVPVGGKTGTAQWNTQKDPHSWFISFGPYPDPEYVVVTLVEEGGEGSGLATQITYEIFKQVIGY